MKYRKDGKEKKQYSDKSGNPYPHAKKRGRGSFTVEASFMIPLLMVCVVILIYVGFYWYNCAVCTGTCYNASRLLADQDGSFSLSQERKLLGERTVALENLKLEQANAGGKITVTASAQMQIPLVRKTLTVYVKQSAYRSNPRAFILNCRLLQGVFE